MSNLGNKEIMAQNIKRLMTLYQKDRTDICKDLGFKYTTFADWCNGKTYPRIDKIEMLANYFNVSKADLVEEYIEEPAAPTTLPPIMDFYNRLNDDGKAEATKRVEELTYFPRYSDSCSVADAEAAYEKSLGIVRKEGLSLSNTTGDTASKNVI